MQAQTGNTTKKAVCRALTNIVKGSPLRASVDPKVFFMTLHSHFAMLQRGSSFDLGPVWDLLSASHRPEALQGLFLKFKTACEELGLEPKLPVAVSDLSAAQQAEALRLYLEVESEYTPLPEAFLETVEFDGRPPSPGTPPPLDLPAEHLRPILTDELKRELVAKIVQAVKAAPVGSRVEAGRFTYQVSQNLDHLMRGSTLNVSPIVEGLREIEGVTDADLYIAIARLEEALPPLGLRLEPVALDLDEDTKNRLLEVAERNAAESREALITTARSRESSLRTKDLVGGPAASTGTEATERLEKTARGRASRLARYGLRPSASMTKIQRYLRLGVLLTAATAIAVVVYLQRPNRPFDVSAYDGLVPMKSAQIMQGAFMGVLDEKRWYKIPQEKRKERLEALERAMRDDGLLRNMQIRDSKGDLVITIGGNNRVVGATVLMSSDGPRQSDSGTTGEAARAR